MHKIHLLRNIFAVTILIGLITVSVVTTLNLTPTGYREPQISGIYTSQNASRNEILSNFIPLDFVDENLYQDTFMSQLVKLEERKFNYYLNLPAFLSSENSFSLLSVQNENSVDITVQITPKVPGQISGLIHLYVSDGVNKYRIHDANSDSPRTVSFTIQAHGELKLDLEIERLQPISYSSELSLEISY